MHTANEPTLTPRGPLYQRPHTAGPAPRGHGLGADMCVAEALIDMPTDDEARRWAEQLGSPVEHGLLAGMSCEAWAFRDGSVLIDDDGSLSEVLPGRSVGGVLVDRAEMRTARRRSDELAHVLAVWNRRELIQSIDGEVDDAVERVRARGVRA